jgi:hypothetical protein
MKKFPIAMLVATIGAFVVQTPAFAQWPASSSNWKSFSGAISNCVTRASNALLQAGLKETIHNAGDGEDVSVYGHSGSYAAEVRCIVSKNIVVFFTTGPKLDQATKYRQAVMEKF